MQQRPAAARRRAPTAGAGPPSAVNESLQSSLDGGVQAVYPASLEAAASGAGARGGPVGTGPPAGAASFYSPGSALQADARNISPARLAPLDEAGSLSGLPMGPSFVTHHRGRGSSTVNSQPGSEPPQRLGSRTLLNDDVSQGSAARMLFGGQQAEGPARVSTGALTAGNSPIAQPLVGWRATAQKMRERSLPGSTGEAAPGSMQSWKNLLACEYLGRV